MNNFLNTESNKGYKNMLYTKHNKLNFNGFKQTVKINYINLSITSCYSP